MSMFRTLRADEIDCRIGTISEKGLSLLLYKDARCDMNILDETVGPFFWQRSHSRDNANCVVAIYSKELKEWIYKEDTGTESNTEAEKGLASDSFKRACFNWGIGRELYTSPFVWIPADKCNIKSREYKGDTKFFCNDKFRVTDIQYADGKITHLEISNENTAKSVFSWSVGTNTAKPKEPETPKKTTGETGFTPKCADCGKEITPAVHDWAVKVYKKPLCMDCQRKYKK